MRRSFDLKVEKEEKPKKTISSIRIYHSMYINIWHKLNWIYILFYYLTRLSMVQNISHPQISSFSWMKAPKDCDSWCLKHTNTSLRTNTQFFKFVLQLCRDTLRGGLVPVQPTEGDRAGVVLVTDQVHLQLGLPLLHVQLEGQQVQLQHWLERQRNKKF